ncbi:serine carboxypeptidase-like 1 isoform X1 [Benincasa hispida]|uniref:serine carboxypeptidase-like 1 isoform X1 n=1 Tax=Benincasa hispida TaxID=102211 RepID=UPI0019019F6F|nr:serine carboxypeptidase-like 1 isoform X1 [Benincasa hispida]
MAILVFRFSILSVFLFQVLSVAASIGSSSTVKFLPGFSGPLPFVLETGYVGVGEKEEVQLFYYFVKSEGNPEKDPLILWHTGGPGCSGLSGLAFEIGPLNFKEQRYNGSLPQLILNPFSWTKNSSIIFLDLPVGTGFSYGKTSEALRTGDFGQVQTSHQFLKKWLTDYHPEFISNPFYVGGDSYTGLIVPIVTHEILEGNKHLLPFVNLQGYILGNPITIRNSNKNFAIPFAHRMALISDELFESLTTSCKGEYVNIHPTNEDCLRHYDTYEKSVSEIFDGNILLPKCPSVSSKLQDVSARRSLYKTPKVLHDLKPPFPTLACPTYKYLLSYYWANDNQVRKALRIQEGSIGEWIRCQYGDDYSFDIDSSFPYHVNLSSKGYRSLIYSGDHDMVVPHLDTQAWIKSLNYSIVDDWRPWFIMDQVAGYTRTYANKMTFATIKGGGHTAEYTQKECSVVFNRWISNKSL